jgi:hypothetical protein
MFIRGILSNIINCTVFGAFFCFLDRNQKFGDSGCIIFFNGKLVYTAGLLNEYALCIWIPTREGDVNDHWENEEA